MKGDRTGEGMGERLTKIEIILTDVKTLLGNHLHHHDIGLKFIVCPIAVGVALLVIVKIFELIVG